MEKKDAYFLAMRYIILILLALPNLFLFYAIATPLTVFPVYYILHKAYDAQLLIPDGLSFWHGDYANLAATIFFKGYYADIIGACVAGAAYYLLLILSLTTPMPPIKRIKSLIFMFGSFLILNIIRIAVFAKLMFQGFKYFDITHILVWYIGSTLLVVIVWFSNVLLFKIKDIPIYTDMKNLFGDAFSSNKKIESKAEPKIPQRKNKIDKDAEDEE